MDWVATIERESAALRDAAVDLDARVPSCPEWDVHELLRHVGSAHHNAALVVGEQRQRHPSQDEIRPADDVDAVDWLVSSTAALADALRRTDPSTPVWTFGHDGTAAFWARRMAHETTVHRIDADQAAHRAGAVDRELADDGIAETLEVFVPLLAARADGGSGALLLHALDGRSWVTTFGPDGVGVELDHRQGDACVQGSAAELLLWLWGRLPTEALTVYGDPALPERLRRLTQV